VQIATAIATSLSIATLSSLRKAGSTGERFGHWHEPANSREASGTRRHRSSISSSSPDTNAHTRASLSISTSQPKTGANRVTPRSRMNIAADNSNTESQSLSFDGAAAHARAPVESPSFLGNTPTLPRRRPSSPLARILHSARRSSSRIHLHLIYLRLK
jgi:hypothetical protein